MPQTVAKQLKRDFWEIYNKRCEPIIPSEQYKQDQELNNVWLCSESVTFTFDESQKPVSAMSWNAQLLEDPLFLH